MACITAYQTDLGHCFEIEEGQFPFSQKKNFMATVI